MPTQDPESTELGREEPALVTVQPPKGFEHQPADYRPPLAPLDPILGLVGDTVDILGKELNENQHTTLAQGLSMRPASPISRTHAAAYDHPKLKAMIDAADPPQAHELADKWNSLGNEIMDFGASLRCTANGSETVWVGQAGTAARTALNALADWSQRTGQGVQFMGTTVRAQAEAAETAKATMPEPVLYDQAQYQVQRNSTSDPAEWTRIPGDAAAQAKKQDEAYAEAQRVVETYSDSLRETNTAMPAFTAPPRFGSGSGDTNGVPTPASRTGAALPVGNGAGGEPSPGSTAAHASGSGAGSPPAAGNTNSDGYGSPNPDGYASTNPDGYASGTTAPAATLEQSVSDASEIPGGGSLGEPGLLPTAAVSGETGPEGGRGFSVNGWRVGGNFGPRGSAGGGGGRGTAGQAERGAGCGFPPVPGISRGEDTEHQRPSYLIETEDVWGDDCDVAPAVIGEDPAEYHDGGAG